MKGDKIQQVELTITIKVDKERLRNAEDAGNMLSLIACDIHQGGTGGFMRNSKGEEHDRWTLEIANVK